MPRPFTLAIVLLTSLAAAPLAQAEETRRPITHEDLWLMPRVGAPEISPDGRFAVFPVAAPAYDSDEQASHLWLVATDGDEPPRQASPAATRVPAMPRRQAGMNRP
jgi:hypothetical protein